VQNKDYIPEIALIYKYVVCRFFHFYIFSILIDAYKILTSADRGKVTLYIVDRYNTTKFVL